ncbi:MAG: class I SAM-dependent methyltransferase [Flavobacteriales bacterium]|nr:class I SAM-dependent methyltransferase [Flavobacteriales bacterium]
MGNNGSISAPFDGVADAYDTDFTQTRIGRYQRAMVWDALDRHFPGTLPLHILELNCGTGTDAMFLASRGHHVIATDRSKPMLDVARTKSEKAAIHGIRFRQLDMCNTDDVLPPSDAVFSDFGGWNCLSPADLVSLSARLYEALPAGGLVVAVIMPPVCLWEMFYFAVRLRWLSMGRRWKKGPVRARVGDGHVDTWYYTPARIGKLLSRHFSIIETQPVGFFVPPSFMEPYFNENPDALSSLARRDRNLIHRSFLSYLSDHYLIALRRN